MLYDLLRTRTLALLLFQHPNTVLDHPVQAADAANRQASGRAPFSRQACGGRDKLDRLQCDYRALQTGRCNNPTHFKYTHYSDQTNSMNHHAEYAQDTTLKRNMPR